MTAKLSTNDLRFLDTGTILKGNTYKLTMRDLLNENKEQY